MGLVPDQDHLTVVNPQFEASRGVTYAGMAHFAGSGPAGMSCRLCAHWTGCGVDTGYRSKNGKYGGVLKPRACGKYQQLMGGAVGGSIPHDARACKYFETAVTPPPIVDR